MDADWGNGSGIAGRPSRREDDRAYNDERLDSNHNRDNKNRGKTNNKDSGRRKGADNLKVVDKNGDEGREWTDFEMQTVLSLLCQRVHLEEDPVLMFATALNEALHGKQGEGERVNFDDDVDVKDVEDLLKWIHREKKGALQFIERQTTRVPTRVVKQVFARNLPYDGSMEEWLVDGRREEEAGPRTEKLSDLAEKMRKDGTSGSDRPFYLGGSGAARREYHDTACRPQERFPGSVYDDGGNYGAQTPSIAGDFMGGFAPSGEARQPQTPIDFMHGRPRPIPCSPIPDSAHAAIGGYAPTDSGHNGSGPDYSPADDPQGSSTWFGNNHT